MMNFNPEILGLIGGTLSCITFVPQIFKTWKSKSVKDISVSSFLIVVCSTIVWIGYGILKDSISVLLTNIIVFFTAVIMLWMKWKFTKLNSIKDSLNLEMFFWRKGIFFERKT
jgi:MtN3 and saliva related transmembrane protein